MERSEVIGTSLPPITSTPDFLTTPPRGFNQFCKNYAYATEVRAHLQRLGNNGETNVVAEDLSALYLKRAGAVAEQQARREGWRLAKVLGK